MNRSMLFIASSIAALCVGCIWLVRKKRRGVGESTEEIGQLNEFAAEQQPIPDEQTAEEAVQSGEAESFAAMPRDPAGGRQPGASNQERGTEDNAEAVQTS